MTPKEKAKELIEKIKDDLFDQRAVNITDEDAVVCALRVVDEIIKELKSLDFILNETMSKLLFLDEVKQEIEKL